jgi:hypothetical protein
MMTPFSNSLSFFSLTTSFSHCLSLLPPKAFSCSHSSTLFPHTVVHSSSSLCLPSPSGKKDPSFWFPHRVSTVLPVLHLVSSCIRSERRGQDGDSASDGDYEHWFFFAGSKMKQGLKGERTEWRGGRKEV